MDTKGVLVGFMMLVGCGEDPLAPGTATADFQISAPDFADVASSSFVADAGTFSDDGAVARLSYQSADRTRTFDFELTKTGELAAGQTFDRRVEYVEDDIDRWVSDEVDQFGVITIDAVDEAGFSFSLSHSLAPTGMSVGLLIVDGIGRAAFE